jgi:hypothetical protein
MTLYLLKNYSVTVISPVSVMTKSPVSVMINDPDGGKTNPGKAYCVINTLSVPKL